MRAWAGILLIPVGVLLLGGLERVSPTSWWPPFGLWLMVVFVGDRLPRPPSGRPGTSVIHAEHGERSRNPEAVATCLTREPHQRPHGLTE